MKYPITFVPYQMVLILMFFCAQTGQWFSRYRYFNTQKDWYFMDLERLSADWIIGQFELKMYKKTCYLMVIKNGKCPVVFKKGNV